MKRLDVVVPAYDEHACLAIFHRELVPVLAKMPYAFRVIYVDDGSRDATLAVCRELAAQDPRVHYIRLSRNFGHQAALTAGLDAADGDAVITMDADLQHPPAALPAFVEAWERGAELVSGVRDREGARGPRGATSRAFYRILNALSEVRITPDAPDFRLLDARVVQAIRRMREQSRFLRGMYGWIGFRQVTVRYDQAARAGGSSKYDGRRMLRLATAAVVSFSRTPLRAATWVGIAVSALSFAYGVYALAQSLVFHRTVPGWTSLAVLLSFLSGVQLLTLGVFGEYLGQVLDEVRGRPLYVVAETSLRSAREPSEGSERVA